jgi:hypothetical protein
VAAFSILAILFIIHAFTEPSSNIIAKTRRALDDQLLWNPTVPRCYIYSKASPLIYWKDIEEHGRMAETKGTPVKMVRFEDSTHCCRARKDSERYWKAVNSTWQEGKDEEINLKTKGPGCGQDIQISE